jgi:hypothetical protein
MTKKILAIITVITGLGILYISTSRTVMKKISDARENAPWRVWWGPHQVDGIGDLARMAYLEGIEKFKDTIKDINPVAEPGQKKIDLYIWGDSYVKDLPASSYYGVNNYHFGRRNQSSLIYNLDTSKINIMIIEIGERFVHSYFYNTGMLEYVKKQAPASAFLQTPFPVLQQRNTMAGFNFSIDSLFNPLVNQNLEYNLFTYNFLSDIRNIKAEMNYKLFNRASGDVVVSNDGNYLFLKETVAPKGFASSYAPISEDEISYLLSQLNILYDTYKKDGFDEVYLSVIPNTVSIVQPQGYNRLAHIIGDPELRGYALNMPVIDIYKDFVRDPHAYYKRGDTHWNALGKKFWVDKVNVILRKWEEGTFYKMDGADRIY